LKQQAKWGVVMAQQDHYKEVKTIHFPGMVARVHIPELTTEERARRMKAIHKQAESLLKKVT
jgi:ribosome recycling factor